MKIVEEFGINPILIAANIVNFTILLLVLKKFLYQPVLKMLDERKAKIKKSLKQAEEIEDRLAKTAQEQEAILKKANEEAIKLVVDASREAKEMLEKTRAESKATAEAMLTKTEELLSSEKERMMHSLKGDLAALMVETMTKVTGKVLTSSDQKRLMTEAKKELQA